MREVSVRMLHFANDLARTAGVDESAMREGLVSLTPKDGKEPDWIDWEDFVELMERLERLAGGAEPMAAVYRAAFDFAYPEVRGFAAVFVRPIPLFKFVMTRLMPTMYRHMAIDDVELLSDDRVRWSQTIPEPFRGSEAFHRGSAAMVALFPLHLDLPEARIERATITPRTAEFVVAFPTPAPLAVRGSRAVSTAVSVLAVQLDEAFARIGDALRNRPDPDSTENSNAPPAPTSSGDARTWAERLALSPRQREVFALLVEGRANKDIASTLRCSERNVEFHVGRILRAARVTSRAELLVKVLGARA